MLTYFEYRKLGNVHRVVKVTSTFSTVSEELASKEEELAYLQLMRSICTKA